MFKRKVKLEPKDGSRIDVSCKKPRQIYDKKFIYLEKFKRGHIEFFEHSRCIRKKINDFAVDKALNGILHLGKSNRCFICNQMCRKSN